MVWDTSVWPRGEMILVNLTRLCALMPMKIKTNNFILILLLRLKGRITIKVSVQNCLTMCKLQLCKGGDNFPRKVIAFRVSQKTSVTESAESLSLKNLAYCNHFTPNI